MTQPFAKRFQSQMIQRMYASRKAKQLGVLARAPRLVTFAMAAIAAVLTFLTLVWFGNTRDRAHARDEKLSSQENRAAKAAAATELSTAESTSESSQLADRSPPAPAEFVKLTAEVSLYNSRGKAVKQFPVGKRLRVSKRAGDKTTIDYLGEEYTIPSASTAPAR